MPYNNEYFRNISIEFINWSYFIVCYGEDPVLLRGPNDPPHIKLTKDHRPHIVSLGIKANYENKYFINIQFEIKKENCPVSLMYKILMEKEYYNGYLPEPYVKGDPNWEFYHVVKEIHEESLIFNGVKVPNDSTNEDNKLLRQGMYEYLLTFPGELKFDNANILKLDDINSIENNEDFSFYINNLEIRFLDKPIEEYEE